MVPERFAFALYHGERKGNPAKVPNPEQVVCSRGSIAHGVQRAELYFNSAYATLPNIEQGPQLRVTRKPSGIFSQSALHKPSHFKALADPSAHFAMQRL